MMSKPVKNAAGKDLITIGDSIAQFHVLPDETENDATYLHRILVEDLCPKSALENMIVRDLVELELERMRCRRWIQAAIMESVCMGMLKQAQDGGLGKKRSDALGKEVQTAWGRGDRDARERVVEMLVDLGIDPASHVLQARIAQNDIIAPLEDQIRGIEERRRRLYDDIVRLQRRKKQMIADAETVEQA